MNHMITPELMKEYEDLVRQGELRYATVRKYLDDLEKLREYLAGEELTQEKLDAYPKWLLEDKNYKKRSVNAMVVSTRKFCQTMGWVEFVISGYTLDNRERKPKDKYISRMDYERLVTTAIHQEKYWLAVLIQTLCHMDIRYSELPALTVERVRKSCVNVTRHQNEFELEVPGELAELLLAYAEHMEIIEGMVFQSSDGKMTDRSNAWRKIKKLCEAAGVDAGQVNMQKFKMQLVEDYYPYYSLGETEHTVVGDEKTG